MDGRGTWAKNSLQAECLVQPQKKNRLPASTVVLLWLGVSTPAGLLTWQGLPDTPDPRETFGVGLAWKGERGRPEGCACAKGEWLFRKEAWLSLVGVAVDQAPAPQVAMLAERKKFVYTSQQSPTVQTTTQELEYPAATQGCCFRASSLTWVPDLSRAVCRLSSDMLAVCCLSCMIKKQHTEVMDPQGCVKKMNVLWLSCTRLCVYNV